MKYFLLPFLIALAGCGEVANTFSEKIVPTWDEKTFTMTVNIVPEKEITDFCTNLGVKYDANGCSSFNSQTKECVIYVVEPRHVDDTERFSVIGHETWHCRFGEWHQ
jgi:hypothetical protein